MGNLTEVKTTFTIDLAPYLEGLKSMLTMTQQTGVQLKPLLNLQIGKADFSQLEKTYQNYNDRIKASIPLVGEAAQASTALGGAAEQEETKVRKSSKSHEEHSLSLNKTKRDSLQAFGAIAFLAQGITQLASSNSQGNKELEKLNQGLSQGISAGFGLAGILQMLVPAIGAWAVGIGAAVAVGVTLLKFLDDGADKTAAIEKATKGFSDTLKGSSLQSLQEWRANLLKQIQTLKDKIQTDEAHISVLSRYSIAGAVAQGAVNELNRTLKARAEELDQINSALSAKQKTHAEWRDTIRALELSNIVNNYDRQRAEVQKWYEDQFNELVRGTENAKTGNQVIIALESEKFRKLNEIDKAEQQNRIANFLAPVEKEKEIDEAEFEKKMSFVKISGMNLGIVQSEIDTQVFAATLARKKEQLAIELSFTDQADEDRKLRVATLLKEIAALQAQGEQAEIQAEQQKEQHLQRMREYASDAQILNIRKRGINQAKSEEQINVDIIAERKKGVEAELEILRDQEAKGKQLDRKRAERKGQLENELTQLQLDGFEARKQLWAEEMNVIDQGYRELFKSITEQREQTSQTTIESNRVETELFTIDIEKRKKELQGQYEQGIIDRNEYNLRMQQLDLEVAKKQQDNLDFQKKLDEERLNSWTSMWNVMERAAMQALENVTAKMIETYATNPTKKGAEHTIAKLGFTGVGYFLGGPLGGLIGGGLADLLGLAGGARVTKPTLAMVGDAGTEYVVPEKPFIQVFKDDLGPRLMDVLLPQVKAGLLATGGGRSNQSIHFHIDTIIGTDDYVRDNLKPSIEKLMRELGASSITEVFVNRSKTQLSPA